MPTPARKGILIVLLAIVLVVAVAVIPDIISEEMRAWCLSTFGKGNPGYLLGFFVAGSVILLFLTTDIGQHLRPGAGNKSADLPPGTPDPVLVGEVRAYLETRYERRLGHKLAKRQPAVNLRMISSTSGTSKEGAASYITLQEEDVRASIGDIFTRANGRLMLVGLPGAGKTTIVLQLALHLLRRQGTSIPVVLNLATWRPEFTTIEDWLLQILPAELATITSLAEQIRKNIPLILLLDGLDELPEADRASCLTAIGEYGADANHQFLISSRIDEYAATKDAPVNAQIEVAPLTIEQVEMGLAATANIQPESKRLLNALKSDTLLRKAVENPFYLNTAQLLFASGKNWSEYGFTATDVAGREQELVDRFIESALSRKVKQEFPAYKSRHWLSFLASRMNDRNMVAFELRDLQHDWWKWGKTYFALNWLFFALIEGLPFGLGIGLVLGVIENSWVEGLISIFAFGLTTGFMRMQTNYQQINSVLPVIITRDEITWSWKNFIIFVWFGLQFFILMNGAFILMIGVLILLIVLSVAMLAKLGIVSDKISTLGIEFVLDLKWLPFYYILCLGVIWGVFLGVLKYINQQPRNILQITTPYQRFHASIYAWHFAILQHKHLCWQLRKEGLIAPDLVAFLNEFSLRHILEFEGDPHTGKDGGAWRFRHRILQEWFAERWVDPTEHQKM